MIRRRLAAVCLAGVAALLTMTAMAGHGVANAAALRQRPTAAPAAKHDPTPSPPQPILPVLPPGPGLSIPLPPPDPTLPPPPLPTPAATPVPTPPPSPTPVTLPDVTITPSALPDPTQAVGTPTMSPQPLVPAGRSDGVAPVVVGILLALLVLGGGSVVLLFTLR